MLVWFDAFTQNVDRTPRNANLLVWHRKLYPIDHGAALFFHHDWETMRRRSSRRLPRSRSIFCCRGLRKSKRLEDRAREADARMFAGNRRDVPDAWLEAIPGEMTRRRTPRGILDFFVRRLEAAHIFEEEAIGAHARLV